LDQFKTKRKKEVLLPERRKSPRVTPSKTLSGRVKLQYLTLYHESLRPDLAEAKTLTNTYQISQLLDNRVITGKFPPRKFLYWLSSSKFFTWTESELLSDLTDSEDPNTSHNRIDGEKSSEKNEETTPTEADFDEKKIEERRKLIVKEIYTTEKNYVESLNLVIENYMKPLVATAESYSETPQTIEEIFGYFYFGSTMKRGKVLINRDLYQNRNK